MADKIIEQFKTCAKCGENKNVVCFYPQSKIGGFSDNCRKCRKPMSNSQTVTGDLKLCSTCKALKPFGLFREQPSSSSGLTSQCHPCERKGWRARNPVNPSKVAITLPNEEWRPMAGYENEFSVSSLGRVRRDKGIKRTFANRLLILNLSKTGYYTVAIHGKTTLVHRLVANAFLEPDPTRPHVNHKSGITTDNRPDNLEWVTHAENMAHAARTLNSWRRGERRPWVN